MRVQPVRLCLPHAEMARQLTRRSMRWAIDTQHLDGLGPEGVGGPGHLDNPSILAGASCLSRAFLPSGSGSILIGAQCCSSPVEEQSVLPFGGQRKRVAAVHILMWVMWSPFPRQPL